MAKVECFEQLEDVEADIEIGEFGIEGLELGVLQVSIKSQRIKAGKAPDETLTLTYSDTIDGVFDWASRTTSNKPMTFGPPARFCRILISLLIFFFFTGLSTLTMHFELEGRCIDSNTSEYLPRPTLRTIS